MNTYFEPELEDGKVGMEWQDAMFRARADAIQERAVKLSQDPLVLLAEYHDKFVLNQDEEDHYPTFVNEVSITIMITFLKTVDLILDPRSQQGGSYKFGAVIANL